MHRTVRTLILAGAALAAYCATRALTVLALEAALGTDDRTGPGPDDGADQLAADVIAGRPLGRLLEEDQAPTAEQVAEVADRLEEVTGIRVEHPWSEAQYSSLDAELEELRRQCQDEVRAQLAGLAEHGEPMAVQLVGMLDDGWTIHPLAVGADGSFSTRLVPPSGAAAPSDG